MVANGASRDTGNRVHQLAAHLVNESSMARTQRASREWGVACTVESVVRAMHALIDHRKRPKVLLALRDHEWWAQLQARLLATGMPPLSITSKESDGAASSAGVASEMELHSFASERAQAGCVTSLTRRETPCAQLELAELMALSEATALVHSIGCAASDVLTHLVEPGTPLWTSCSALTQAGVDGDAFEQLFRPLSVVPLEVSAQNIPDAHPTQPNCHRPLPPLCRSRNAPEPLHCFEYFPPQPKLT